MGGTKPPQIKLTQYFQQIPMVLRVPLCRPTLHRTPQQQADLVSLDSGDRVDTTSPTGKAFFQIAGVFAELEWHDQR